MIKKIWFFMNILSLVIVSGCGIDFQNGTTSKSTNGKLSDMDSVSQYATISIRSTDANNFIPTVTPLPKILTTPIVDLTVTPIKAQDSVQEYPTISEVKNSEMLSNAILFEANWDGDSEIYSIDPSNHKISQITNNEVDDWGAVWSPDGIKFGFLHGDKTQGESQLYLLQLGKGEATLLTPPDIFVYTPYYWSPNGQMLAFGGNDTTYIFDIENINLMVVDNEEKYLSIRNPVWSYDGQSLAYLVSIDSNLSRSRIVVDLIDSISELILLDHFDTNSLAWHPFQNSLLFISIPTSTAHYLSQIYMLELGNSNPQQLTDSNGLKGDFAMSPDGQWIAYTNTLWAFDELSKRSKIINRSIGVISISDVNEPLIVFESEYILGGIGWSPDSSNFVFVESSSELNAKMYVYNVHKNSIRSILHDIVAFQNPSWQP